MKGISKKIVKLSCPIKIQSLYNLVNVLRKFLKFKSLFKLSLYFSKVQWVK